MREIVYEEWDVYATRSSNGKRMLWAHLSMETTARKAIAEWRASHSDEWTFEVEKVTEYRTTEKLDW